MERYLHVWMGYEATYAECRKNPVSAEKWAAWLAQDPDLEPTDLVAFGDNPAAPVPLRMQCPGSGRWKNAEPADIVFTLHTASYLRGILSVYRDRVPMYLEGLSPHVRAKATKIAEHLGAQLHEHWIETEEEE